ncbi:hypothetical protein [Ferruginibacter profundus]
MSKQKINKEDKSLLHELTGPEYHNDWPVPVYELVFIIGPWRKAYTAYRYKLLICRALNKCIGQFGFTVVGYLLTNTRLCLVLVKDTGISLEELQKSFYSMVYEELNAEPVMTDESKSSKEIVYPLFKYYPIVNDYLSKLMTNRKADPGYYDPDLARLEKYIANYNFCSAIDYRGATGPVNVTVLDFNPVSKKLRHD